MASLHPIRKVVPAPEIPDKLYFRIGEVAKLCGVAAYVLRFWETEFPRLKPNKGGTGQRLYRRRDVEMALRVKHLLYDQGFTIPGARQVLQEESRGSEVERTPATGPGAGLSAARTPHSPHSPHSPDRRGAHEEQSPSQALIHLRQEMQALHAMLSEKVTATAEAGPLRAKALRPTLVEEKTMAAEKAEQERAAAAERLRLAQGDLFGDDVAARQPGGE